MLNVGRMQDYILEYSPQGNKKIFSWSTLELVINKLENLVIFRNSLEGGTHVTSLAVTFIQKYGR